jgi:hypothetical protein
MPTLMVVAVIPTSLAGTVFPLVEAAGLEAGALEPAAAGALEAADDVAAADEPALPALLAELQPAATRAAARTAITPSRRARAGSGRPRRLPPGLSLLAVTLVPSMTSLPVSVDPATLVSAQPGKIYTGRSVKK